MTPGSTGGGGEVRQEGRQPMEGLPPSKLSLWAAGAQSCRASLGASIENPSQGFPLPKGI